MANSGFDLWLDLAKADLETAEVILKQTKNYHISVYHAHQAIEKIFKRFLLIKKGKFPYIHDLIELLRLISEIQEAKKYLKDISLITDLYASTRYPHGDKITKEDARDALNIAKKIFQDFNIE